MKTMKGKVRFNKKQKADRGITLIALVITIIVLLILAGVTIAMLTGENGILKRTIDAKQQTEKASEEEQRQLTIAEATMNLNGTKYKSTYKGEEVTVPIPAGFAVSQVEGENTVKDGLVIIDEEGNEFVWVPVTIAEKEEEKDFTLDYTPMAEKKNGNYIGILYKNWNVEDESVMDLRLTDSACGEPGLVWGVTENEYDAVEENLQKAGVTGDKDVFLTEMKNDYDEMINSVIKYGGFYVARYEMSYENGKVQYQKGKESYYNETHEKDNWYGYYKKQRNFATVNNYESVKSSMIWGSQYDAMINWMARGGIDVNSASPNDTVANKSRITGAEEKDVINNIYDLLGNSFEWTLEKSSVQSRRHRGGCYNEFFSPSVRHATYPMGDKKTSYCSRATLYLVD